MQGQRSAIGSLSDSINFDYGSSSNMGLDQQIYWNALRDPAEGRLSEFRIAPDGDSVMGMVSQEVHNLSRWNTGEPSSRDLQNLVNQDERMTQNGWSTSMRASAGAGPRLEGQLNDAVGVISRNGVNLNLNSNQVASSVPFFRTSNSGTTSQSHDLSLGQLGQVGDLMECSHPSKSGELEHRQIPSSSGSSEPYASSSGSGGGFLADEEDVRPGYSLDGRRLSCKRKTIEGNVGQSSSSTSCFSREGSMWQAVPSRSNAGSSSLRVSPQLETSLGVSIPDPENPRLRLSMGGVPPDGFHAPTMGRGAGSSHRNYSVRMNPTTSLEDSLPNNFVFPRVAVGHSDVPPGHQPLRFTPVNPSPHLTAPIHPEDAAPDGQPVVLRLPGLRRNVQSVRWSAASSSRAGGSSAPLASVEMDPPLHEDLNSRPMPRNISEHPMFMPSVEARNASPHNAAGLNLNGGGSGGTSRHMTSSSRAGPGSSSRSSSGPTWGSHRHPPGPSPSQYSRRLSEYVRRQFLSSAGSEGGSNSAQRAAQSSQEAVLPSTGGTQGHNPTFSRSAMWMDRRGDSVVGIPYSLRALAAGGEGITRLVSEQIRNVLDRMRRGEGLRFEDIMILDPSVLFGMADIHDQHRDMRLDIDNMSYEELLALEERIGNVSTGLSEETILARLKRRKYVSAMSLDETDTEPCCVCQEEYKIGEDMGVLDCGHDFHAECIKQWLGQKNACPICKTIGLAT